jgi:hypothetical protein
MVWRRFWELFLTLSASETYGIFLAEYSKTPLIRLFGTASHPDMQKIPIIGFFFENRSHWQFEVRLLLFTACTCV